VVVMRFREAQRDEGVAVLAVRLPHPVFGSPSMAAMAGKLGRLSEAGVVASANSRREECRAGRRPSTSVNDEAVGAAGEPVAGEAFFLVDVDADRGPGTGLAGPERDFVGFVIGIRSGSDHPGRRHACARSERAVEVEVAVDEFVVVRWSAWRRWRTPPRRALILPRERPFVFGERAIFPLPALLRARLPPSPRSLRRRASMSGRQFLERAALLFGGKHEHRAPGALAAVGMRPVSRMSAKNAFMA
jgi:hypothetical protein